MSSKLTDSQLTIGNGTLTATNWNGNSATATKLSDSAHNWQATEIFDRFNSIENNVLYKSGGTITGPFRVNNNPIQAYMYGSNNNAAAITFDKPGSYAAGIGSGGSNMTIKFASVDGMNTGLWTDSSSMVWNFIGSVYGAVANDYADAIIIPENNPEKIEPGYCYCIKDNFYYKSNQYCQKGIIGIDTDTYSFITGIDLNKNHLNVSVSGFVLAYVDKIYEPGTPLTCTKNGYLTEIKLQDKRDYPERIVGTFWKEEKEEIWEPNTKKVKVNGRHWIKVK